MLAYCDLTLLERAGEIMWRRTEMPKTEVLAKHQTHE